MRLVCSRAGWGAEPHCSASSSHSEQGRRRDADMPLGHRWYTRPVLFVADVNRALRFYIDMLGFEKRLHEGDGAGMVCQVNRGECEIILCEDAARTDKARLFVALAPEG